MFGNILIDKFRCYMSTKDFDKATVKDYYNQCKAVLSKHFAKNAYFVDISKTGNRLTVEFTPTRYFKDIKEVNLYTDTNLEMPCMEDLLELFEELPFTTSDTAKITKLHLTKNILVKYSVKNYIEMLSKREYKYPYHILPYLAEPDYPSLKLSSLATDVSERDNCGDRSIIYYDKVEELANKGVNKIILKTPLTDVDLKNEILNMYNTDSDTIELAFLNILRSEMKYESSMKLSEISKFLGFECANGLLFENFYCLLREKQLYQSLDEFYTYQQKRLLCPTMNNEEALSIWHKIIADNWETVMSLPVINVYKETDLWEKYHKSCLKIQNIVENYLYEELKIKFSIK